jgi:hypothetical protein
MSVITVTTDTEVANIALDMVKEATITDLDENRAAARWMKRNFIPTRNLVLTSHVWKFAMKRAEIPEDPTPPDFEWSHRYPKPSDCFRVLPLRVGGTLDGRVIPHQVEGNFILTSTTSPLKIRYISEVANIAEWPAPFVWAVASRLAAGIAHTLTGKMAMVELSLSQFREALALAASLDSAEGSHAQQYATDYNDARYYVRDGLNEVL